MVAAVINFPSSFSLQVFVVLVVVVVVWFDLVSSEREIHCTTSLTCLRNWICQKHSYRRKPSGHTSVRKPQPTMHPPAYWLSSLLKELCHEIQPN